ncbi:unnamed protein product [Cyprideis torosa]|uniref:Uncharacterized protein n=1 Tax=Cyprideis torosa TaxID=163714 RepID=A0A7R8W0Q0_9CRUS|nr:unnamed protein product [Cyprideis torosa]CAG0878997.1 unnamed protein product [Cyprideis torosa]
MQCMHSYPSASRLRLRYKTQVILANIPKRKIGYGPRKAWWRSRQLLNQLLWDLISNHKTRT